MKHERSLLRQDEAWEFLRNTRDPITNQLLNCAVFHIIQRFISNQSAPIADLDLRFLLEALEGLFNDHETLKRILNGEDLRWWTNDNVANFSAPFDKEFIFHCSPIGLTVRLFIGKLVIKGLDTLRRLLENGRRWNALVALIILPRLNESCSENCNLRSTASSRTGQTNDRSTPVF